MSNLIYKQPFIHSLKKGAAVAITDIDSHIKIYK